MAGFRQRHLPTLAYQLQHHHAEANFFQRGLLLGLQLTQPNGCGSILLFQMKDLNIFAQPGLRPSEKERAATPHSSELYTYANYVAYVLFPPLYIAGPILTFNNFLWQVLMTMLLPEQSLD